MTFGSLFAGIGGFDLGLERAGMRCEWQVENDPFCVRVLSKHWPTVKRFEDVRDFPTDSENLRVDVIAGGFPCQDISVAGRQSGINAERSGLWWEMLRVCDTLRPKWIVIENVPQLRSDGLHEVLCGLAGIGFDAEWETLSAAQFGFAHLRRRMFIVAHANGVGCCRDHVREHAVDCHAGWNAEARRSKDGWDLQRWITATYKALGFPASDPTTRGKVDGIPDRLDRIRSCGNAVIPAIAEWIGRRIMEIKVP